MRIFRSTTSNQNANTYVGPFGEIVVGDNGTLLIQNNVTPGGTTIGVAGPTGPTGTIGNTGPTGPASLTETGNITFTGNLISSNNGNIVIGAALVPSSNATIDLGTADFRWRSLYVSSNTIYIGDVPISTFGSNLVVGGTRVPTLAQSLPPGGIAGQILAKASNQDYDVVWVDPPGLVLTLDAGTPTSIPTSIVDGGGINTTTTSIIDGGGP